MNYDNYYKNGGMTKEESISAIALRIGARKEAVAKFVEENDIDTNKMNSDLKSGKVYFMDIITAIVGKPNNKYQKEIIKKYGSKMAMGGKTQGYDDREDERLGMDYGKIAGKDFVGSHSRMEHSRRDDARFEERMAKGGELTYDDFIVGDFYSNSSEGGKFKFVGKDESGRLRFEDSKGINRIFSPKRMNKYADGGMMARGGKIDEKEKLSNISYQLINTTESFKKNNPEAYSRMKDAYKAQFIKVYGKDEYAKRHIMADGGMMAMGGEIVKLESVGTAIDTKTKMTYPILSSGEVDLDDDGVYLSQVTDEWMQSLSKKDRDVINAIKKHENGGMMADGGELTYDDFMVGDFYSNSSEGGKFKFVGKDESGRLRFEDSKGINRIFSPKRMNKYADGGMMARGGYVSKGELVWKKLNKSERMKFLHENFTPQITPRSQETLVGKDYNFLPKNVKIVMESKYANVEDYADGGMMADGGEVFYVRDFYPNYDEDKIVSILKSNGLRKVRKAKLYGMSNLPQVAVFEGDKSKAQEILEKEFPDNYISIYEKDWGRKMADGGETERDTNGMLYALQEHVSSGEIASKTNASKYADIDEIRSKAIQYYMENGDKPYSYAELESVLKKFDHTKYAKGGRVYKDWTGSNSKETWGQENLYPKYNNTLDLIADVSDYYKELSKDVNENFSDEQKNDMIEVLKTGKKTFNDGATLKFANGGRIQEEDDYLLGYEPYFEKNVPIASIDRENKIVRPTSGYFPKHPMSKKAINWAKKHGYDYIADGKKYDDGGETERKAEALKTAVEIATMAYNNGVRASDMSFEDFSDRIFGLSNTSYPIVDLRLAYQSMKNANYAEGGYIDEDGLHELARLVMDSIDYTVNISLDEFIKEVSMTGYQRELCMYVLNMFNEYENPKPRLGEVEEFRLVREGMFEYIKNYYLNEYPHDNLGADINPKADFDGLLMVLNEGDDVYEYLDVSDSLVRERVFEKLANIMGVEYNVIYDMWLSSDDKFKQGGIMANGGKIAKDVVKDKIYFMYQKFKLGMGDVFATILPENPNGGKIKYGLHIRDVINNPSRTQKYNTQIFELDAPYYPDPNGGIRYAMNHPYGDDKFEAISMGNHLLVVELPSKGRRGLSDMIYDILYKQKNYDISNVNSQDKNILPNGYPNFFLNDLFVFKGNMFNLMRLMDRIESEFKYKGNKLYKDKTPYKMTIIWNIPELRNYDNKITTPATYIPILEIENELEGNSKKFEVGGIIEDQYVGRTAEDIWDSLSQNQRSHFIYDHAIEIEMLNDKNYDDSSNEFPKEMTSEFVKKAYRSDWKELDEVIQNRFANHVRKGEYAKGGYMADGGGVGEIKVGDKVIITTKNLGKQYEGMLGEITPTKLLNNKFSIKLENGMTMAFDKGEFRHNSVNPKYAKGGMMADGGEIKVINLSDDDKLNYFIKKQELVEKQDPEDDDYTFIYDMLTTTYNGKKFYSLGYDAFNKGRVFSLEEAKKNAKIITDSQLGQKWDVIIKEVGGAFGEQDFTKKQYVVMTSPLFPREMLREMRDTLKYAKGGMMADGGMMAKGGEIGSMIIYKGRKTKILDAYKDKAFGDRMVYRVNTPIYENIKNSPMTKTIITQDENGEYRKIERSDYVDRMAKGGEISEQNKINKKVLALVQKANIDSKLEFGQLVVSALTDANAHSEVRKFISIIEKKPEWAEKPKEIDMKLPREEYEKQRAKTVYSSKYYDANEEINDLGIKIANMFGWDFEGILDSLIFASEMSGRKDVAQVLEKLNTDDDKQDVTKNKWDYTDVDDIEYVVVKDKSGKELKFAGKHVLSGVHDLLEKGGKLSEKGKYYSKDNVVSVVVGGKNIIDKNTVSGVWIMKDAKPIADDVADMKIGKTTIRKGFNGWVGKTMVDNFKGFDWDITTIKTSRGDLVTTAQGGKSQDNNGYKSFSFMLFQDPNFRLKSSRPARVTDKVVSAQHEEALKEFKERQEEIAEMVDQIQAKKKMADGGAIGFDALAKKVAKNYEGDDVKKEFQKEYGKTYDKKEAEEVGKKVAAKVYRQQKAKGKMAKGGETSNYRTNSKLARISAKAKEIRKANEPWRDAFKRAKTMIG